jgi:hypothetical protein
VNIKEGQKPNRLIHEKSPYLLQHAHNPVDWLPWGEEASYLSAIQPAIGVTSWKGNLLRT